MTTHGEQRLGMLTSSTAHTIMHGGEKAWTSLRNTLWTAMAEQFDGQTTGARAFGHEQEEAGVAKFWLRHPEVSMILPGGFHVYPGNQFIGSSPDRLLLIGKETVGLEVKSPTALSHIENHDDIAHFDQCQHGLLVTGFPKWYLVDHFENEYREFELFPDALWQARYLARAKIFIDFAYRDRPVKRRKLSIHDLED